VNPKDNEARLNLTKVDIRLKQFEEAWSALNEYLRQNTAPTADVWLMKSVIDLSLGRFADTVEDAWKAHAIPHASVSTVHVYAAKAWEQLGRSDEAIREYRIFLDESRQVPLLAAMRAEVSMRVQQLQSRPDEAATPGPAVLYGRDRK
jgi:tetratricopeptide (TPR) repeat protein